MTILHSFDASTSDIRALSFLDKADSCANSGGAFTVCSGTARRAATITNLNSTVNR